MRAADARESRDKRQNHLVSKKWLNIIPGPKTCITYLMAVHRAPFMGQNIATLIPAAEYCFLVVLYWLPWTDTFFKCQIDLVTAWSINFGDLMYGVCNPAGKRIEESGMIQPAVSHYYIYFRSHIYHLDCVLRLLYRSLSASFGRRQWACWIEWWGLESYEEWGSNIHDGPTPGGEAITWYIPLTPHY